MKSNEIMLGDKEKVEQLTRELENSQAKNKLLNEECNDYAIYKKRLEFIEEY